MLAFCILFLQKAEVTIPFPILLNSASVEQLHKFIVSRIIYYT